ncbi:MAG: sigma-54-dependent Fis family transcriptional regulator [Deltaproteobacteria bacterium]|nr:sigma-54-dependent Fis family transcriptional regulator [Deltaproteobacteria bacterium]MBN2670324.1 sigma-54-dependent Fis family transcriptional regulator [Deltaproteobacteria bacterium]
MTASILAVDDREGIRLFIKGALEKSGYHVDVAEHGRAALQKMEKQPFHLVITDLKMPVMDGMTLLTQIRQLYPQTKIIVLTAHGTIHNAVEAMKEGATDYLTKPLESPAALRELVQRTLTGIAAAPISATKESIMVADSPQMKPVLTMLRKVAPTDATVLLTGQSGTGKEVAAQQLHLLSPRRDKPFVAINCAAISAQLMESEMFGHEKGAFTGAIEQKKGRFESADGGTLFLDEVGELPLALQAKLLRVIQEQTFERVGGTTPIQVDVRIIAATNRNLLAEISEGTFREDLYHRLSVFPIHLPSLAERKEDIPPLAEHFLSRIAAKQQISALSLSEGAVQKLITHPWPGNIRELSNTLERAAIMCTPPNINADDLIFTTPNGTMPSASTPASAATGSLKEIEKSAIQQALQETDGHRKRAAERLGISLRSLYNKLKEYGIE